MIFILLVTLLQMQTSIAIRLESMLPIGQHIISHNFFSFVLFQNIFFWRYDLQVDTNHSLCSNLFPKYFATYRSLVPTSVLSNHTNAHSSEIFLSCTLQLNLLLYSKCFYPWERNYDLFNYLRKYLENKEWLLLPSGIWINDLKMPISMKK